MALFIQKPVFWNTRHYLAPSGALATSGYPKKWGYGHEEWNNSPRMLLTQDQHRYRVFHTERLRAAPVEENAGQTFVFMTVSHDRIQQLVGIAGNVIGLWLDHHRHQREEITKSLLLYDLWKDAWAVPNVQKRYRNDQQRFLEVWGEELHWIPNWICPDDFYWWLDEPVTLNPLAITGKKKLCSMFGSYKRLDLPTVGRLLDAIPAAQRHEKWSRLMDAVQSAPTDPVTAEDM